MYLSGALNVKSNSGKDNCQDDWSLSGVFGGNRQLLGVGSSQTSVAKTHFYDMHKLDYHKVLFLYLQFMIHVLHVYKTCTCPRVIEVYLLEYVPD